MIEPRDALVRLADWGFIATCDLPDRPGPASLLVAIRERPTLAHYDPERVEYWTTRDGRGLHATITRETATPVRGDHSWGLVRIVDRLGETNEYASFGGQLAADRVDDVLVVVLASPVPMLRLGGHSQGWDPGATSVMAFFGRLLVAVDFRPGFEHEVAAADPATRYAAFLHDTIERYRKSLPLREANADVWRLFSADARRLAAEDPQAWTAGAELLQASTADPLVARSA